MEKYVFNARLYDDEDKLIFSKNYNSDHDSVNKMNEEVRKAVKDVMPNPMITFNEYLKILNYNFIVEVIEGVYVGGYVKSIHPHQGLSSIQDNFHQEYNRKNVAECINRVQSFF